MKEKKTFLKSYLLQEAKINRLYKMVEINPDEKESYLLQIDNCIYLRKQIEEKISLVEDEILKEILIEKYICGKTLEEISFIINYSKRHTERLHISALQQLEI